VRACLNTYVLTQEHAAVLINAAVPRNLARYTQYVAMLAEVEADVIESFRHGGGVPYAKYPRFQALMAESSALRFDALLIDKMAPLTGMGEALASGIQVLDVGCGQGRAINLLAQAFPRSRFTGYDVSERCLFDAGHRGVEPFTGQSRASVRAVSLQSFDDALHDRVASVGRRGFGRCLGRATSAGHAG
jgi:SAM-dependent methyltransferase